MQTSSWGFYESQGKEWGRNEESKVVLKCFGESCARKIAMEMVAAVSSQEGRECEKE